MKKYIVTITGKGEGCDYCIRCNEATDEWEADNYEHLFSQILDKYSIREIEKVLIYDVTGVKSISAAASVIESGAKEYAEEQPKRILANVMCEMEEQLVIVADSIYRNGNCGMPDKRSTEYCATIDCSSCTELARRNHVENEMNRIFGKGKW